MNILCEYNKLLNGVKVCMFLIKISTELKHKEKANEKLFISQFKGHREIDNVCRVCVCMIACK